MSERFAEFGGSLTADVLLFDPDATPEPDTLCISVTRGEHRIADELRKSFGGFKRVIIDVDGERYEFRADSLIRLLESYEGARRWHELFGTPERAARTLAVGDRHADCGECVICEACYSSDMGCLVEEPDVLLEWLRGDA